MLDLKRLTMLREVARTGSIAAAASSLHITASAGSQQLRMLEREVGVALLERSAQRVRLTEAGRVLVEHAVRVFAEVEAAERAAHAVAGLRGGRLRLGSFSSAGAALLPSIMATFRRRHPDVRLSFLEIEPEDALPAVRTGDLDVAVVHRYGGLPRPELRALQTFDLFAEPLLLAHQGEQSGDAPPVALDDFSDAEWISIVPTGGFQAVTELACRAAGFDPLVSSRADDYSVVRQLVAHGLGVALVPRLAALPTPGVAFREVAEPQTTTRKVFAVARDADPSPAVADMLALLAASTATADVSRRG